MQQENDVRRYTRTEKNKYGVTLLCGLDHYENTNIKNTHIPRTVLLTFPFATMISSERKWWEREVNTQSSPWYMQISQKLFLDLLNA